MKVKNLNLSLIEENGEVFFNIDIPEVATVEGKSPTVAIAPQIKTESCLFNYGWCTSPLGLNIRETTDLECKIVGVLDNGQRFKIENVVIANDKKWYEISAPITGFIDAEFTQVCTDTTLINDKLVDFVASWESFRPVAYRDAGGLWTIGFGHCCYNEKPDYTLTVNQALELLHSDLKVAQDGVIELTEGLNLNENEFNALVDFVYNLGADSLKISDLLIDIKECLGNQTITEDFTAWSYCGKTWLQGLCRRRLAEAAMFLYNEYRNN